jgi:hypothetical protein
MTTHSERFGPTIHEDGDDDEDMDVRKPSVRVGRAGSGRSRRSLVATTELLGGLSNASAEAFRCLNSALVPEAVATEGLRGSVFTGLRDGNSRFFEELAQTSRRVFDALRVPEAESGPEAGAAQRIDYDQLARKVAAQMKGGPAEEERHSSGKTVR